ncbi:hypothetical protein D5086_012658 [Populus alba]|uniref:Uncharacterized protein n=1 Tax=Populus alba TaxID=43335 RepID=A0ACC4C3X5_POPAL
MECAVVCVLTSKDFLNIVCFDQFYLTGFEVDQVLTTEANDYLSFTLQFTAVFITHVGHGLVTPHSKQQCLPLISALLTFSPREKLQMNPSVLIQPSLRFPFSFLPSTAPTFLVAELRETDTTVSHILPVSIVSCLGLTGE